ncbi:cuticle protein 7-like [Panulirus ornatus]|uniref:cuticle protein 7-like n=1 Tax=Panulirus ornatus TaxID=150431 RepID=UPI003A851C27
MALKVVVAAVAAVVVVCVAADGGHYGPPVVHAPVHYAPIPYDFAYGVADHYTGTDFGHKETSDGKAVKGVYYVLLPDGRKQIVTYTADHYNGYQAQVTYEGTAHYPQPVSPPAYG